ncbi:hypothetical protein LTR10_011276 [Elasticomyces elasticus]|nr:hypothetical protein LTR10_011276 [Elasticomyces elasticus]
MKPSSLAPLFLSSTAYPAVLSASTFSQCFTSRVPTSVKNPTTATLAYTYTWPITQYSTSTPTRLITPTPSTTTVTSSSQIVSYTVLSQSLAFHSTWLTKSVANVYVNLRYLRNKHQLNRSYNDDHVIHYLNS